MADSSVAWVDGTATDEDPPRSTGSTSVTWAPPVRSTPPAGPDDVLYAHEIRRSRVWVALCTVIAVFGLLGAVIVTSAPALPRVLVAVGSLVQLAVAVVAMWVLRDERRYARSLGELYSYVSALCMVPGYYFCGWFSAVVLLLPMGGILFGLQQARPAVIRMAVVVCGSHGLLALAAIFDVISDRSVYGIPTVPRFDQVLLLVFVQLVTAAAFGLGQQLRGHFLDAVERYGQAVRDGARRDALLQEALLDLDLARRGGQAGRFTGLELGGFRIGEVIGRGGMGEVYEARPLDGGAPVAIKVVTAAGAHSDRALARFDREIRIAASLASPHLARVIGYSSPHDPIKYLAMERLVGRSLAEILRDGTLPVQGALAMFEQIAAAVDLAHGAGIVHRDLKPSNLFRHDGDGRPRWKVLDFGVSKLVDSEGTLTAGAIVGTPAYMAPEQARGVEVGPRADLFSLGAIAYRVLVGRPAFGGRDLASALYEVVHAMPPRPSSVAAVPRDVDRALAIALAKSPRDRFASAHELVGALAGACAEALPAELRRRGDLLMAACPWHDER